MNLPVMEILQKVTALAVLGRSRMEYLLHDLLHHLILLLDVALLTLQLSLQLLVLYEHLIELLLQRDLLLVELLLVCVLQALRQVRFLIQILFSFLVCKVCNALQSFRGLPELVKLYNYVEICEIEIETYI